MGDLSVLPDNQWEVHNNAGIAFAMNVLTEDRPNDETAYFLVIQVKNISDTTKELVVSGANGGFKYFYLDPWGKRQDLRLFPNFVPMAGKNAGIIEPGKVFVQKMELKFGESDTMFIQSQFLQCDFCVRDRASSQGYDITTSPKLVLNPFFLEKKDMDSDGSHVVLSADKTVVKIGERFQVAVSFYNGPSSQHQTFFNPDFEGLTCVPAQLAVFDGNKQYLGDFLMSAMGSGSFRGIHPADWVNIAPSEHFETTFHPTFHPLSQDTIGIMKMTDSYKGKRGGFARYHEVVPGDYYLQMIYSKLFISEVIPDEHDKAKLSKWYDSLKGSYATELFRSNVVKITVVE